MKKCELCKSFAKIYCESDQASLCWRCDAIVHSANFLVARHSRSLLCHSCQSRTQWQSSGRRLEPSTVSICDNCLADGTVVDDDDDDGTSTDNDVEEYAGDDDEIDLEDTPPPTASSSSGSKEFSIVDRFVSTKRRSVTDLWFEDDLNSSSAVVKDAQNQSLPLRSEAITVHKLNKNRKRNMTVEDESAGNVVGEKSKATRAVGFDLNSSDWTM